MWERMGRRSSAGSPPDSQKTIRVYVAHAEKKRSQGGASNQEWSREELTQTEERFFITSGRIKVMAVSVSRDLTVQVLEDVNVVKLTERQQALRSAIRRGEPKCLGVSQVMLGLMVMSYSIPLHFTEVTQVVSTGVPWWSGATFIIAGVIAIILDKHCTIRILWVCLFSSVVSTVLSVVALIIYVVDMNKNPEVICKMPYANCDSHHYASKLSRGVKASLLLFTLAQAIISAVVCFLLFRQRRSFGQYSSLTHAAPSTPTMLIPPDLN